MQPLPVVEDLDVVGDGEPCAGSGGEVLAVEHFVLQRGEERLGGRVVPADTGPAKAGSDEILLTE